MRFALATAFALHAALVVMLALYGTPRPLADVDSEPPGITVIFSRGGGGESAGERDAATPPETAEPQQQGAAEAQGETPSEAVPQEAPREDPTTEAEPAQAPPRPAEDPPPAAVTTLPLPPPPPPPPPSPSTRSTAEAAQPSPCCARGAPQAPPAESSEAAQTSAPEEGSAAFLLATRPASVGRRVDPVVPIEARQARMQGRVELVVTISPEGIPTEVDVLRSSGHFMLDRAAQEALWQWRFDPARRGGVPVEEQIVIPFTFRIVN